jgi:hypothetical protein
MQFIICGDININYLVQNNRKNILDALLASYNLSSTVYFPTRLQNKSAMVIDNIFIDTSKFANYVAFPRLNGLSDHDAQLIKLSNIDLKIQNAKFKFVRKIDKYSTLDLQYKLSFETWNSVFDDNDLNTMFNSFLSIYLQIFYSSFPLRRENTKTKSNVWITLGLRTSCKCKRDLYLLCRNSNDIKLKEYYKLYSRILFNVIKEAKNRHYNSQIKNADNKMKTVWDITKSLTGKKIKNEAIQQINIGNTIIHDSQVISNSFNNYFLSVVENHIHIAKSNNPMDYLYQAFIRPFPTIKYQNTPTFQTEKIIKSLKSKGSHGYDGISLKILKLSSPFISSPLNHICNKLLSSGIFPCRLKYVVQPKSSRNLNAARKPLVV